MVQEKIYDYSKRKTLYFVTVSQLRLVSVDFSLKKCSFSLVFFLGSMSTLFAVLAAFKVIAYRMTSKRTLKIEMKRKCKSKVYEMW